MKNLFLLLSVLATLLSVNAQNQPDANVNLALSSDATLSGNISGGRGVPLDILYDPSTGAYATATSFAEYGAANNANLGLVTVGNGLNWQVNWTSPKTINYITFGGSYPNQPQLSTMWRISYLDTMSNWIIIEEGEGGWINEGIYEWDNTAGLPITANALKIELFGNGTDDLVSIHLRARGGTTIHGADDSGTSPKATLIQYLPPSTFYTLEHIRGSDDVVLGTITEGYSITEADATSFNVNAITSSTVVSTTFALTGPIVRNTTENNLPHTLYGDQGSTNFNNGPDLTQGNYTLTVTGWSALGGTGTQVGQDVVNFTVITADTQAPTAPTLSSTVKTDTSVDLSWTASTDNTAVTGYKIFKDGVLETTLGNVLTYQVTGLTASTAYNFTVTALDAAGNESNSSNTLGVTTQTTSNSSDLVAYYSFDNTVNDLANSNNATIVGNPNYVAGIDGQALNFDGIDDHLTIPSNPELAMTEFTISALVYIPNSIQSGYGMILEHDRFNSGWYGLLKSNAGNYFRFIWGQNLKTNFNTEISPDTWYHVVATYDGTKAVMYLNGIQDKEDARSSGLVATNTSLSIASNMDGNEAFKGIIDDLRIYNSALTPTQVSDLYNTYTFTGDTQSPTAPTLSSTNQTDTTVDLSWTAGDLGANVITRYIIQDENSNILAAVEQNEFTYQATGLSPETLYRFKVMALNEGNGASITSNELAITTDPGSTGGSGTGGYWSKNNQDVYYNDGKVGIGTDSPDELLAVNGTIHSKEVKVDLNNWPDYVFTKNHQLPTLKEIEEHIQQKGHLPNIPSAKEVEENGIELGEINAKLLEKIEELTLYILQQDKDLKAQTQQNQSLEKRLLELEILVKSIKE